MESLKELVLRKIIYMQTVSTKPDPKFRVDSIALALHLPIAEIEAGIKELVEDRTITYHPPAARLRNHPISNFGEVSLNLPIEEAKKLLHRILKLA